MIAFKRFATHLVLALCFAFYPVGPAQAQSADEGEAMQVIRDAEIENYLRELATPIYRAADINPSSVTIVIVNSNAVNAFVAEGMNEFFYTGLLQLADTPEQLAGVIAHETGHISGGHLIRGKEQMKNASAEAILGTILAVAAGAVSGNGNIAAGGVAGGNLIAERSFLSFNRAQEASADSAGMSFLDQAGITTGGMLEFFHKLAGQELLPSSRQEQYVRTHPLTEDRIEAVVQHFNASPQKNKQLAGKFATMHARMKAKLLGYLQPETALLRYTDNDPRVSARYARAIALYRTGKPDRALAIVDGLLHEEPSNPFFFELKGQIQFDNGRIADSIANYRKANELLPTSSLLHQAYGHALLESKEQGKSANATLDLAIQQLQESNRMEDRTPMTWRFLAAAWGRKAELTHDTQYSAMATYALAEEAAAQGNDKAAQQLAERAMKGLAKGSTYWLRAQDISLSIIIDDESSDKIDKKRR